MTISELYAWATENHVENYPVEIQYADDGGFCYGIRVEQNDITVETRTYGKVVAMMAL